MENLSNELKKLKIDKSQRTESYRGGKAWIVLVALILVAGGLLAVLIFRRPTAAAVVVTVRPRSETSSHSAVLVASGYVVAHHRIQVVSKIGGRVAWIGGGKGER